MAENELSIVQSITTPTKLELKSQPGAWVSLKPLSYGEVNQRQDLMMDMVMQQGNARTRRAGGESEEGMKLSMANTRTSAFVFSRAIVEHNLAYEGPGGTPVKFDFRQPPSQWIDKLPPLVGKEIEAAINRMNGLDEEGQQSDADFTLG